MLYLLLGGEFVAAGQVLVYGGAVMVMFLFVIAYLGDKTDEAPWAGGPSWQVVGDRARRRRDPRRGDRRDRALDRRHALALGARHAQRSARRRRSAALFLTDQLLAFEVTSIVLLVAAVGGVVLGSHARTFEADADRTAEPTRRSSTEPSIAERRLAGPERRDARA